MTKHARTSRACFERWIAAAACAIVLLVGCSDGGGGDADDAPGSVPADSQADSTVTATPQPTGESTRITAELRNYIPMTDDEAACVASRLADDPDTSSELAEGVTPGNEAFDRSEEFAADCAAETTYLPKLLDSLNKQLAPTAEARACIETAFVELTAAELTTITLGGSLPDGRTLQTVVTECGAG